MKILPTVFLSVWYFCHFAGSTKAMKLHSVLTSSTKAKVESLTTVLIHGLDSSSQTWTKNTLTALPTRCIAMDQRGCGRSELGDPTEFSQEALVQDIHELVLQQLAETNNNIHHESDHKKLLLLGHSLGGRIALAYAATHPEHVAALVIEDMDIQARPVETAPFPVVITDASFDRHSKTLETATTKLKRAGYPNSRIDRWVEEGRIEPQEDGSYWSHINPLFRKLCYQHVLGTAKGQRDFRSIASDKSISFPVYLLVAGSEGTICNEESVQEMKTILGDQLTIHRYPTAGHSIHSSATKEFLQTMESIIANVSS